MRRIITGLAVTALFTSYLAAADAPKGRTPNDIVDAAPVAEWTRIAASDLVVMDLAPDEKGRARRAVIQLIPAPFSQGWVGNIRKFVAARWFDGIAVVRVQDNYVVQWGDPDGETPGKAKALPAGMQTVPQRDYVRPVDQGLLHAFKQLNDGEADRTVLSPTNPDAYLRNGFTLLYHGWPIATDGQNAWPLHCYGMVGVGRNLSPDTGTGAELYTVIGQAPRQLDRNIALVGRVISGMEHLSSLPRGTGPLGFYKTAEERTPIISVRTGDQVSDLPAYEYLSTESASFTAYADKRANRKDDFYITPAGGVDVCNVPVPIREVKR
ncbi:peptidylprolyl isomerase [Novosphingobium sp. AP12]|uniref:peptidylprolyl isomerase n=1 Tax=Novosphingobium sp. AP12 TaxID=1144305 RepID=UPI0002720B08|nr:peptidylprolyl isomerase [Novosphingobium sp. AP12]EJL23982.1 Cyclophilin type peptidyl-prolyl cis-trans isomerase/CLD [Novosphingobium sp. AP12]